MKKYILRITISLSLISCNTSNENKIIGKWKGLRTQEMYYGGEIHQYMCEIEFSENGKGWMRLHSKEENYTYPTSIFEYKIVNDSIIFPSAEHSGQNLHIEYISDSKLILKKFNETEGTNLYEIEKTAN